MCLFEVTKMMNSVKTKVCISHNNNYFKYLFNKIVITNSRQCHIENTKQLDSSVENNVYSETKLLKVAIIGVPNAGKSTLINNLMDRKVCPTSNKVHTTRKKTHAVLTDLSTQIVFLDTPGIVSDSELKRYNLENSFRKDCTSGLNMANVIGVIHDVSNTWTQHKLDTKIIKLLEQYERKSSFLVLNKIDALKSKRKLLDLTKSLTQGCINNIAFDETTKNSSIRGWPKFSEIFMISALTGDGVQQLKNYLINQARPGKFMYPETAWSNHSPEDIILRTVQATLLDFLPQEIPYKLKSSVEYFEVGEDGKINSVILVKCPVERIKNLVSGVNDGKLRQITEKAQKDLLNTFDKYVRLRIVVTCDK